MRMRSPFVLFIFLPTLFLGACALTPDFPTEGVDLQLTPKRAVAEIESVKGQPVIWGGVIIAVNNLKESTEVEILAYPLDMYQRPVIEDMAHGRFLAIQPGYLETADYAQGRHITVKGTLGVTRNGRVGESDYVYPVVNISQLHLWPKEDEYVEPRVRFGIGVMIRN
ncbi:Slp family lipoprotein [Kaarinaea lacus]